MGISEAIARVRRGAARSSLVDGALSYIGVRLRSDLGARLRSGAIPSPLRPLATRIATLIGATEPPPFSDAAVRQLEVVSLDRALVQAAQRSAAAARTSPAEGGGDVCPFTGLRADGTLAETPSMVSAGVVAAIESSDETALERAVLAVAEGAPPHGAERASAATQSEAAPANQNAEADTAAERASAATQSEATPANQNAETSATPAPSVTGSAEGALSAALPAVTSIPIAAAANDGAAASAAEPRAAGPASVKQAAATKRGPGQSGSKSKKAKKRLQRPKS